MANLVCVRASFEMNGRDEAVSITSKALEYIVVALEWEWNALGSTQSLMCCVICQNFYHVSTGMCQFMTQIQFLPEVMFAYEKAERGSTATIIRETIFNYLHTMKKEGLSSYVRSYEFSYLRLSVYHYHPRDECLPCSQLFRLCRQHDQRSPKVSWILSQVWLVAFGDPDLPVNEECATDNFMAGVLYHSVGTTQNCAPEHRIWNWVSLSSQSTSSIFVVGLVA